MHAKLTSFSGFVTTVSLDDLDVMERIGGALDLFTVPYSRSLTVLLPDSDSILILSGIDAATSLADAIADGTHVPAMCNQS